MSFESLRSSRKAKEAKSFVQNAAITKTESPSEQVGGKRHEKDVAANQFRVGDLTSEQAQLQPFQVRKSSIAGRGVFTAQAHKPGSVITAVKPYVSVLSTPYLAEFCTNCSSAPKPPAKLKRCTRCRVVWYCEDKCQTIDWSVHKYECRALQKWEESAPSSAKVPSDAIRCLGRIVWGFKLQGLDSEWTREVKQFQSHRTSLPPSAYEPYTHIAHSLIRYLGVESPLELEPFGIKSTADLVDTISRFTTNAFTLTSYALSPIGVALSPITASINHSCDPNAVIIFPRICDQPHMQEPQMNLVVINGIAPGEEVTISYIDVTLSHEDRQKALKETYNFDCKCTLCSTPRYDDPRTAMFCPARCGGIRPIPTEDSSPPCKKCKATTENVDGELDALNVGQEALGKATAVQHTDPRKAIQLTTNIIPILMSAGLTPSCHPLLAMTRLHQELLIASLSGSTTQEALDETIRTAARYVAGLLAILPAGHPVRGVALAELGKLLAVDEPSPPADTAGSADRFPPSGSARLKLAHETLVRARGELLVGFGTDNSGGLVGREVRETIVRLEQELGAWTQGIRNALDDVRAARSSVSKT
ncbi:SET domain-containing protein [Fomitopsis serialis]|uniref:SET domain-containing protein n=1 Tax=Fomitopsis serialis TaxID=139415 RepID=UPI002007F998|nr:SET domain-containing protein [Neoantrodia serialis]KAH9924151.1 SET domain-containing protein [Neoantrodia serialis]